MNTSNQLAVLVGVAGLAVASSSALGGFAGQTILGPLGPGSVVAGSTVGATDDNDGFTSGDHFFFIWNGPDDVYALNWPGGDMSLEMTYNPAVGDLDLFLYEPSNLDDSGNYSIINSGVENIFAAGAPAGTYYIVIDSPEASDAGAYTLSVTPAPGTVALPAIGLFVAGRRSRRSVV